MKYLFFLSFCFFLSCQTSPSVDTEKLKTEVFAIHDEVMPRSMKAEDLMTQVSEKYATNASLKEEGLIINSQLKAASDSMNVWMMTLNKVDSLENDKKAAFLEMQKTKGNNIKTATEAAIANAEKFIK